MPATASPEIDPNLELRLMGLGDLPSIGSAGHLDGTCKRCVFHEKGRCTNGAACNFCHYFHEKRPRKPRVSKSTRERNKTRKPLYKNSSSVKQQSDSQH